MKHRYGWLATGLVLLLLALIIGTGLAIGAFAR